MINLKKCLILSLAMISTSTNFIFANEEFKDNETNDTEIIYDNKEKAYVTERSLSSTSYTTIINQYNFLGGVKIKSYSTNPGKVYLIVNGKNYTLYPGDTLSIPNVPNTDIIVQAKSGTGKTDSFKISLDRGL